MQVPRRLGRVLVGLLPAALLLGLCELALRALGAGATPPLLSRGFDPRAAYLVADPETPGGWRTQMFDGTSPERVIPPKQRDRRRVLLFGGSNTGSFPAPALEWALDNHPRAAADYEVHNLGRAGYGSLRVAILFEQALEVLEPDLVVIYSGHNEFVEAGFRQEIGEELSPAVRSAASVASHLRTFNALCDLLRPEGGVTVHDPAPETWKGEFDRFLGFTYDQTLERFEGYRDNLTRMCRLARERDVAVVIGTVISNPLAPPFSSTLPPGLTEEQRSTVLRTSFEVFERFPARFRHVIADDVAERTHVFDWMRKLPLPSDWRVPELRTWPAPVVAGSRLIPPPENWSQRGRRAVEAQEHFFARELTGEERTALEEIRAALEAVLAIVPDMPQTLYRLGAVRWLLGGDDVAAVDALYAAATFDRAPRKGNDVTNGIVRELVASMPELHLFDAERLYRSRAPDGLIGLELMKDECHLHDKAYNVLMLDLADSIVTRDAALSDGTARRP